MMNQRATETEDVSIWWDDQDPSATGWAWTLWINGNIDGSGPLDGVDEDSTNDELIGAFRDQVTDVDPADITITDYQSWPAGSWPDGFLPNILR